MRLVKDRDVVILNKVKNKKVLDVGCIDHNIKEEANRRWLHRKIKKNAKKVVGLDLLKKEITLLRKKGYEIKYGNIENVKLKERFDVIVAGELIEHVLNQGLFLDNAKRHLKKNGILILTTPNVFTIGVLLKRLFFGRGYVMPEHVLWHDVQTLRQLLILKGFKVSEEYYTFNKLKGPEYLIQRFFCFFRKSFAPRLLIVAKLK